MLQSLMPQEKSLLHGIAITLTLSEVSYGKTCNLLHEEGDSRKGIILLLH